MKWAAHQTMSGKVTPIREFSFDQPIHIGISASLLGEKVRFDGGHKHDRYATQTLGQFFEWVPICPEVKLGLGTPRETIRLEQADGGVRMVMPKSGCDPTDAMRKYAMTRERQLAKENLGGRKVVAMAALIFGILGKGLASDLKVGDSAPGIRLKTDEGKDFDLNRREGRPVRNNARNHGSRSHHRVP